MSKLTGTVAHVMRRFRYVFPWLGLKDSALIIPGLCPGDPLLPSAYRAAERFVLLT